MSVTHAEQTDFYILFPAQTTVSLIVCVLSNSSSSSSNPLSYSSKMLSPLTRAHLQHSVCHRATMESAGIPILDVAGEYIAEVRGQLGV